VLCSQEHREEREGGQSIKEQEPVIRGLLT
jgi:hypothetical protein